MRYSRETKVFKKILIANRGEIAVRIIRTCRRLGLETLAVYSEVDARAPYVREADEAVPIGGALARESYLDAGRLLAVALERGASAVHPGYGFLSESAAFARQVASAGLTFIGPTPEALAALGDKMASKVLAIEAGVPVVPGHHRPLPDGPEALKIAERVGWPLVLKPAAGGGGRGMRIVSGPGEFPEALASSREETRKGFGDDRIFIERYITRPRHIEMQILADHHGQVIYLGERECSIQRRYQKVIEETPSPAVSEDMRQEMGRVSQVLVRAAGYTNAGTIEFILDPDGHFYFLEVNTRLQVEHPITEMVTGLDLVELQIRLAAGEPLPLAQEDVRRRGWAIEARICAEDPARDFLPTTGIITRYAVPRGQNIRVDSGIEAGSEITIHYDSLLAKVAAWGTDREEARQTLIRALNGYHLEGMTTNADFVNAVVNHPAFAAGDLSTGFIAEHFSNGESLIPPNPRHLEAMVMAATLVYHNRQGLVLESLRPMSPMVGGPPIRPERYDYVVRVDETVFRTKLESDAAKRRWTIHLDGRPFEVLTPEFEFYRRRLAMRIDGVSHMFRLQYDQNHIKVCFCGMVRICEIYKPAEWDLAKYMLRGRREFKESVLSCPMPGLITAVLVSPGDEVRKGQVLFRMESMKMESAVASSCDGLVEKVLVTVGQAVESGETLLVYKR